MVPWRADVGDGGGAGRLVPQAATPARRTAEPHYHTQPTGQLFTVLRWGNVLPQVVTAPVVLPGGRLTTSTLRWTV